MRAYIANRMTNVAQFNYPWFDGAAKVLRARGIDAVSPAEMDAPEVRVAALASPDGNLAALEDSAATTWGDILAKDVKLIADGGIEAVIVGPEWHLSKGAKLETFVAFQLGLPILRYPDLEPVSVESLAEAWSGGAVIAIDAAAAA